MYISKYLWQFSFHYDFKYLVILTIFACLHQVLSVLFANSCTMYLRSSLLLIWLVLSLLIDSMTLATKLISLLLFLTIVYFLVWIFSAKIEYFTVRRAWSDDNLQSGWIVWLSNSSEFGQRNMRSIIEFKLLGLSTYIVETWTIVLEIPKFKESAISISVSLWIKWLEKREFQKLLS